MANRSYLYAINDAEEPRIRDLSEWSSAVPVAHLLLVSRNSRTCPSELWTFEEGDLAVEGDAAPARALLLRFLNWLRTQGLPNSKELARTIDETIEVIERPDRQGVRYHLEPGEVFDLYCADDAQQVSENARLVELSASLAAEVERLIETPGATLASSHLDELRQVATKWEESLGLYFSKALYFHFA